jgi:hypothetical protein
VNSQRKGYIEFSRVEEVQRIHIGRTQQVPGPTDEKISHEIDGARGNPTSFLREKSVYQQKMESDWPSLPTRNTGF